SFKTGDERHGGCGKRHSDWRDYVKSSLVEQVCAFVSVEWFAVVEYRLMGCRSWGKAARRCVANPGRAQADAQEYLPEYGTRINDARAVRNREELVFVACMRCANVLGASRQVMSVTEGVGSVSGDAML
ncbi:hypothetical protein EAH_00067700, partial [Eimeria acervulina]